jgi:hypothetical protein
MILITTSMVTDIQTQSLCGVLADSQKSDLLIGFQTQKQFQNLARFTIFNIVVLLLRLHSLLICTHDLIILTKTKEMIRYCVSHIFSGKTLSTIVSIVLTQVSVRCTCRKWAQQSSTLTHALKGSALTCPLMPTVDQHIHARLSPTSYSQTTKIS